MLVEQKLNTLLELINNSTNEELIWINGYLNGILSKQNLKESQAEVKKGIKKITITYGTETGNSKKLASHFAAKFKQHGVNAKLQSLDQYRLNDLSKEEYFLAILSTHGDGEPPAAAKKFYDHVHQNDSKLSKLKYSVLALGDTSYPLFCKAGEDVDQQLNKLGGNRIAPLQKCDIDFQTQADEWFENILASMNNVEPPTKTAVVSNGIKKSSGRKYYTGKILSHINLNDVDSSKQTFHIEIESEEVEYAPGDSIGIIPQNKRQLVEKIISLTATDAEKIIEYKNESFSIFDLLQKKLNLVHLPLRVVKNYASIVQQEIPETRMDLLDLLKIYPVKNAEQFEEILKQLEPIAPRLYSICSSPEMHSGEVHITVAKNCFKINNETKYGLASELLSLLNEENELEFYVHPNHQFRLPEQSKNVIMIGPGTGIAPFRSFLSERDATGAGGKNWLFFGDQHFTSDFLYQTEIQNWVETNLLTKVDTAFSRDQEEKIYVQHKMLQKGADLFQWLEEGSYVYICGCKDPMSIDVEDAVVKIIEQFGNRTKEEAQQYLLNLKEEGRYVADVY